ncbi:helix-turn-helix domain-containing protein [Martelella radicis]|uniref:Transcriptional regulator with XRE-family HTH domain n=1 Tax=Martelella radicis TaxID=1397476 RepID=A0A7W6KKZ7_9HYPH|nr:helix-turn-helix domain-containing protein [Martelella radicis]MBB4122955.1 transcriptional regulator with XRE-family HTH domain [Martelella radicis]
MSFLLMARPEKPKTALGQRLIDARKASKFPSREDLATFFDVKKDTLATYERGIRDIPNGLLARYYSDLGVNLSWLMTGDGPMFDDPTKAPPPVLHPELMQGLVELVVRVHKEFGITLPGERKTAEATVLYNRLLQQGLDTASEKGRDLLLPFVEQLLRERLQKAKDEPGTGKREVS